MLGKGEGAFFMLVWGFCLWVLLVGFSLFCVRKFVSLKLNLLIQVLESGLANNEKQRWQICFKSSIIEHQWRWRWCLIGMMLIFYPFANLQVKASGKKVWRPIIKVKFERESWIENVSKPSWKMMIAGMIRIVWFASIKLSVRGWEDDWKGYALHNVLHIRPVTRVNHDHSIIHTWYWWCVLASAGHFTF